MTTAAVSSSGEKSSSPIAFTPARAARPRRTWRSKAAVEPVLENQPERDVEAADQRDRRRERRIERVLRLLVRCASRSRSSATAARARAPAPGPRPSRARAGSSAPSASRRRRRRCPSRRSRAGRRRARRSHRRRAVASPTASLIACTSETTPVEVSDCWQSTISAPDLAHRRAHLAGVGRLAPLVADRLHVEAVLLADRDPTLAERAVTDDGDLVARRTKVRDGRLHRARAGRSEEEHVGARCGIRLSAVRARSRRCRGSRRRGGGPSARRSRRAPPEERASGRA